MKYTLKPRKASYKDYSAHKTNTLGATPFQNELLFLSTFINQGANGECTAYASAATRDSEVPQAIFDPEIFWGDELVFNGVSSAPEGFDLKTPAAVGVETGFVLTGNQEHQNQASAYLWITAGGGQDLFDNIRSTIQLYQRPVMGGLLWYYDYITPDGVMSDNGKTLLGGHCVKIAGWTTKNNIPYLVIQNSWGMSYGDGGKFYMPRELVNKAFPSFGVFYWSDDPTLKIKKMGLLQALLQNLVNLYQLLIAQKSNAYPPALVWTDQVSARHSVRVICDEEGLSVDMKNILCACVKVESNFIPTAVHYNKDKTGAVWSADWGIVQINDFWNIGEGKPFPSTEYVLQNPEACVRFMCKQFLAGNAHLWASYSQGLYKQYL